MQTWIHAVGCYGLREVRKIKGYHDELLKGKRAGQYSIRLNKAYRAIYIIEHDRKSVSPQLAAHYAEILGYSREQFIQLALQNIVDRAGLQVHIKVEPKYHQFISSQPAAL